MSNEHVHPTPRPRDSYRDARQALAELAISLCILGENLLAAEATLATGDRGPTRRELHLARFNLEAAHGYLAMARDEHRDIGRALEKVPA